MHERIEEKPASESYLENVEFIRSGDSYHDDTAFGGQLFAWMDNAVTISVMKHSGKKAVWSEARNQTTLRRK